MSGENRAGDYHEPAAETSAEIEIKKSRFIGTARKVLSPAEAQAAIREERSRHPGARHVAFAFLIGPPAAETAGMSDGGEPKGTAGRPVFEVLKGERIRNVLVTVTRYFGGTKLGTGGLVRAYSECCRKVLGLTPRAVRRAEKEYFITAPYECFEALKRVFSGPDCRILHETFEEEAGFRVCIADAAMEQTLAALRDAARGRARINKQAES